MAQATSAAVQMRIMELLRKMQEKEEERKKKKQEVQAGEDAEHQHEKEKDQTPDRDNMPLEASSSRSAAEVETGSKEVTTSHLIKKPESTMKTTKTRRPQSTAQQAEDTSQKTITVQSRAGQTITLE